MATAKPDASRPEPASAAETWAEVRERARSGAPDQYLAALLAPRAVRDDLIAVAAVVAEIDRIPGAVREPMMGEIRLQWWRDALPALASGETSGHPVADRFGQALRRRALPAAVVAGMTEARAFDLYPDPFPDDAALTGYLAKTHGAAFALAARVLGVPDTGVTGAVIAAAGQGYGRACLLRDLPQSLAAGKCPLPADALARHGLAVADLAQRPLPPAGRALLGEIAADARRHLAAVRAGWAALPAHGRPALLPVALIEPYLQAFESGAARGVSVPVEIAPLRRVWRLWWAHRTGRV